MRRSRRRRLQDEFEVLAKAEVEHLVGFVEHHGLELRDVERAALDVVAKAPRRADDDMRAGGQFAPLAPWLHAADAGNDARARILIEPGKFSLHLEREFARRRDDQRERLGGGTQVARLSEQIVGDRETIGDRLAGTRLRGDEKIAVRRIGLQHRRLHGRRRIVVALRERARESRYG